MTTVAFRYQNVTVEGPSGIWNYTEDTIEVEMAERNGSIVEQLTNEPVEQIITDYEAVIGDYRRVLKDMIQRWSGYNGADQMTTLNHLDAYLQVVFNRLQTERDARSNELNSVLVDFKLVGDTLGIDTTKEISGEAILNQVIAWRAAMQKFVDRVDSGEIRSINTRSEFAELLAPKVTE